MLDGLLDGHTIINDISEYLHLPRRLVVSGRPLLNPHQPEDIHMYIIMGRTGALGAPTLSKPMWKTWRHYAPRSGVADALFY